MDVDAAARTDVVTAERTDTISSVVGDMAAENVGSVVVVEDDRPIGVLTDRSVALALGSTPDLSERTAEELLDGGVVTASMDDDVFEALDRMRDAGVRRVPLVDDEGELRGIVTLDDVLLFLEGHLGTVAETVREQFPDV